MASPDVFSNVSFSDVSAASPEAASAMAVFGGDAASGAPRLGLVRPRAPEAEPAHEIDLSDAQIFGLGPTECCV